MKMSDAFPSKYLKAADLQGRVLKLEIDSVDQERIGNDVRIVAYFRNAKKGLVLNKTNATVIASRYGDESDDWRGCEIELYPDKTQYQGQLVDCIRVRLPLPPAAEISEDDPNPF